MLEVHHVDLPEVSLPPGLMEAFLGQLGEAARTEWVRLAMRTLMRSRQMYIEGIQRVRVNPQESTVSIALVGAVPNIVENGAPSYDMHDTLLGPNVPIAPVGQRGKHQKKGGGYYRSIPFRHSGPDTVGTVGQPMGRGFEGIVNDTKALGKAIYAHARQLQGKDRLPKGLAPKLKPRHHSDPFAGMQRSQKKNHGQYFTFRTISTGSPGWIRGATQGVRLGAKVGDYVAKIAPSLINAFKQGDTK